MLKYTKVKCIIYFILLIQVFESLKDSEFIWDILGFTLDHAILPGNVCV